LPLSIGTLSCTYSLFFFFEGYGDHRDLHSFPTRRSSDLDLKDIDYLAFPRLPGYGEIGWSPAAQRDWEDYSQRLGAQQDRFEIMGIGYYPSDRVSWGSKAPSPNEYLHRVCD